MLGILTLDDTHLKLATNSAERARRGREVLCDALGARIGDGLAVHDAANANLEGALRSGGAMPTTPIDTESKGDVEEVLQNHLDAHYRRTLDEPIPMLGDRTPRECAADPDSRSDVLMWLKTLENTDAVMPSGAGFRYNFTWLWAELDLEEAR